MNTVKETAVRNVTAGTIGIAAFLLSSLFHEYLPALSPIQLGSTTQGKVILLLLLWCLWSSFVAIVYYRKSYVKPPAGGYSFCVDPGYYIHIKTGGHYCNPCLSKGFASRLSIHHIDGLKCRLCREVYIDPKSEHAAFAAYCENNHANPTSSHSPPA